VLSPSGEVLDKTGGYHQPQDLANFLQKALDKLPKTVKVARAAALGKTD
jgi:hypothetical protein